MVNAVLTCMMVLLAGWPGWPAPIAEPFDPPSHYGIDFDVEAGAPVEVMWSGTIAFSGAVVGFQSVTVHVGGGVKHSYSFIFADAPLGDWVETGDTIGLAGPGEHGGFHFSVRVDDQYVDPLAMLRIGESPGRALSLVSPPLPDRHNLT